MVVLAPRGGKRREDALVEETQLQLEVVIILKRRRVHAQTARERITFFLCSSFPEKEEEKIEFLLQTCRRATSEQRALKNDYHVLLDVLLLLNSIKCI